MCCFPAELWCLIKLCWMNGRLGFYFFVSSPSNVNTAWKSNHPSLTASQKPSTIKPEDLISVFSTNKLLFVQLVSGYIQRLLLIVFPFRVNRTNCWYLKEGHTVNGLESQIQNPATRHELSKGLLWQRLSSYTTSLFFPLPGRFSSLVCN